MEKPSWSEAPKEANYLAMDQDGTWVWYETKPTAQTSRFKNGIFTTSGRFWRHYPQNKNWANSVEKRRPLPKNKNK